MTFMDDPYAYTHLYRKFLQGTCTPDEVRVLLQQFGQEEVDPRLAEAVAKALAASDDVDEATRQRARAIVAKSDGFIYDHIVLPNRPAQRLRTLRWIPYAAAAVLICAIGVFAYFGWPPAQTAGTATQASAGEVVLPGKSRAIVTLADGRSYNLASHSDGIIVDNGAIRYENGEAIVAASEAPTATIATPRGGQYKLILPDSTTVWLNADSRLVYPLAFTGKERVVTLEGEAYFSVAHNSRQPFVVHHDGLQVRVLGTEFNLKSYADEPLQTTLVSGSVDVRIDDQQQPVRLRPGNQFSLQGGQYTVTDVNTLSYTGWKDGIFYFHHLQLDDVLRQLERWYDVSIPDADIPDINVYGEIDRDTPLREVLDMLELITPLHFELNERRITIR